MTASGLEEVGSTIGVYDAAKYLARDVDGDGVVEIVVPDWSGDIRVVQYQGGNLVEVGTQTALDGVPIYTNGTALTDSDGDGEVEIIAGTGHAVAASPGSWGGRVYAIGFDATSNWAPSDDCSGCYDTAIGGLFSARVGSLFVHDVDGDGAAEISASVQYFSDNQAGVNNPSAGNREFIFDAELGTTEAGPGTGLFCVPADLDNDGTPECIGYSSWVHDVDGDGDQDQVRIDANGRMVMQIRDGSTLTDMPPGEGIGGGSIRYLGDLDNDGRLDV